MPLLSVTLIGLVVGLASIALGRRDYLSALMLGPAGAWAGFVLCGIPGVMVDVVAGSGVWVAVFGHVGAIGGALITLLYVRPGKLIAGHRGG